MKKTKKPNKKGILRLAADLVANKKRYNQNSFGGKTECGTFCCLAGFCLIQDIGLRKFNKELSTDFASYFEYDCKNAGIKNLGLDLDNPSNTPPVFRTIDNWPTDIQDEYHSNGLTWRVIAALKGLQRLRVDGTIDPNPKAVHTRIPQLKVLLAEAAKKEKK